MITNSVEERIEKILKKEAKHAKTLQFGMIIPDLNVDYSYSNTVINQRFHSASAGKLLTSTLIFIAIEQGKLKLDSLVNQILGEEICSNLFVYNHNDYQSHVTIEHLLGHTSGVNDYFESKAFDGSTFVTEMIASPDSFFRPNDLLEFTRSRQRAVSKPGDSFHYSDTGFIVLGLVVEKVYSMPFHEVLYQYIFQPCEMHDTSLCFYSANFDQSKLAPLYIDGTNVQSFTSLSCDFSGGGLSTTVHDLLKFLHQLHSCRLISQQSLDLMSNAKHKYRSGIYYGLGMMQLRFKDFFYLLKDLPSLYGHLGVTGVHAWYDPISHDLYVLNIGNTQHMVKSFKILIKSMQIVHQAKKVNQSRR